MTVTIQRPQAFRMLKAIGEKTPNGKDLGGVQRTYPVSSSLSLTVHVGRNNVTIWRLHGEVDEIDRMIEKHT
jgi:hypothetical protein